MHGACIVRPPACLQMVDVGCGIGGSSRYISAKTGCSAQGITLSPKQAARANEISKQKGYGDKLNFQVRQGAGVNALPPRHPAWPRGCKPCRCPHAARVLASQRRDHPKLHAWSCAACFTSCATHSCQGMAWRIVADCKNAHGGLVQVADALNMPFADASFDLVWSMESGEHMPNKK